MIVCGEISKKAEVARFTKTRKIKRDYEVENIFVGGWKSMLNGATRGSATIYIGHQDILSNAPSFSVNLKLDELKELVRLIEEDAEKKNNNN
jgi:hypothetical protein